MFLIDDLIMAALAASASSAPAAAGAGAAGAAGAGAAGAAGAGAAAGGGVAASGVAGGLGTAAVGALPGELGAAGVTHGGLLAGTGAPAGVSAAEVGLAQQIANTSLVGNAVGQVTSLPSGVEGFAFAPGGMGPPAPIPSLGARVGEILSGFGKGFAANAPIGAISGAMQAPRGQRTKAALRGAGLSGLIGGTAGGIGAGFDPNLGMETAMADANGWAAGETIGGRGGGAIGDTMETRFVPPGFQKFASDSMQAALERAFGEQPLRQVLGTADAGARRGFLPSLATQAMFRLGGEGPTIKPFGRYGSVGRGLRVSQPMTRRRSAFGR